MVSAATVPFFHCNAKAIKDNTTVNMHDCVAIIFYLQRRGLGWMWSMGQSVLTDGVDILLLTLVSGRTWRLIQRLVFARNLLVIIKSQS